MDKSLCEQWWDHCKSKPNTLQAPTYLQWLEAKVQALEECRELVERTVTHADLLFLDLPPEMVGEFRQVLAKINPPEG